MKLKSLKLAAALSLVVVGGLAHGGGPNINWGDPEPTVPNLAPPTAPPEPLGFTLYKVGIGIESGTSAMRQSAPAAAKNTSYCVTPFFKTVSRSIAASAGQRRPQWNTPFTIQLVNVDNQDVGVPVNVPAGIPADTTRELLPNPPWCVKSSAGTPPEVYMLVTINGQANRARVNFNAPKSMGKPQASTR